jgi:hypothetical protein
MPTATVRRGVAPSDDRKRDVAQCELHGRGLQRALEVDVGRRWRIDHRDGEQPSSRRCFSTSRESFEDGRGSMSLATFWITCPTTAKKGFLFEQED